MKTKIEVQCYSAAPCVLVWGNPEPEEIIEALPRGWIIDDETGGSKTDSGGRSYPLIPLPTFTTRDDAVAWVEDGLGSEGSRALAEAMLDALPYDWEDVPKATGREWDEALDEVLAAVARGEVTP